MDARGVGVDWKVAEIRKIAQAMLGSVDIIGDPSRLGAVFEELMRNWMARGVASADLGSGSRRAPRCCSSARSPPPSRT